jgi:hypothetical protein
VEEMDGRNDDVDTNLSMPTPNSSMRTSFQQFLLFEMANICSSHSSAFERKPSILHHDERQ